MKKILVVVILLVIGVVAYTFLSRSSEGEDVEKVEGIVGAVTEVANTVAEGFENFTDKELTPADKPSRPRYTLDEAGEKVYTTSEWIGTTFYSYRGNFSFTIPDNWVQMTPGQYNQLYDRSRNTMYLGTVDDAKSPKTQVGMARLNLRSALARIDNTHDRVMNQFNHDEYISVNNIPTFLTPIEIAGTTWYYFKSGRGESVQYYYGTFIEGHMYIMWIYHDDAYPVENILAMFGTLEEIGAHSSPNFDRTKIVEQIYVEVPHQLPDNMPLRILGMAPVHIPIDFQEEIRQGIHPEGLQIPPRESFNTHIALQVNGNWIWDLTADTVETLEVAPFILGERTMVPVRIIAEILGAEVSWYGETQTVTLTINDGQNYSEDGEDKNRTVSLVLDELNPEHLEFGLDVPATRVGSTTFVPLRFVSEFLGAEVYWMGTPYRQIDIIK